MVHPADNGPRRLLSRQRVRLGRDGPDRGLERGESGGGEAEAIEERGAQRRPPGDILVVGGQDLRLAAVEGVRDGSDGLVTVGPAQAGQAALSLPRGEQHRTDHGAIVVWASGPTPAPLPRGCRGRGRLGPLSAG